MAEGYDSSTSTPIPVQIEGTDFEGNSVSTETLVGSNGAEPISLMRGNYTLSVTASPISEDGTMFDVSESASEFEVVGDSDEGEGQGRATVSFSPLEVEDMTEDMVSESSEKLTSLGYSEEEATKFTDAALAKIEKYQEELAEKKAAEEAAKKAAEEAAKRHISTDWYEFDISQQWVGKVEWSIDGDTTTVYPKGYPEASLISIHTADPDAQVNAGDVATGMVHREVNGRCAVELWHSSWIYIAADHEINGFSYDVPDDAYEPLVELISGGSVTYDDIVANPEKYLINDTFVEEAIAPTVVVKDVPPAG